MTSTSPDAAGRTTGASQRLAPPVHHRARRSVLTRHAGLALWLLGALLVAVLAVFAHQYPTLPGDVGFSTWLQQLRHTPLAGIIELPANIDEPKPGGVIAAAIIAALLLMRRVIAAICAALASFGADGVNVVINTLVARPRPHGVKVPTLGHLGQYSFPSGHVVHVTGLFGFVLFLSILVVRAHPAGRGWVLPIQVVCIYFLACVGLGRIIEGAHWPSDVLAGYLVGALMLAVAIQTYRRLYTWNRDRRRPQRNAPHAPWHDVLA